MDNTNETLADILREMRDKAAEADGKLVAGAAAWFRYFADRIEAAAKLERGTCKNCAYYTRKDCPVDEPAGNAAALREALEHIEKMTREFIVGNYYRTDYPQMVLGVIAAALLREARAAIGEDKP